MVLRVDYLSLETELLLNLLAHPQLLFEPNRHCFQKRPKP